MRVYYFTSSKHAISNIRKRQIKISFPDQVNDIYELKPYDFLTRKIRKRWQSRIVETSKREGFVSLSSTWNNPTMWGHYGDNNKGVCLGFDVKKSCLVKIKYVDELKNFDKKALEEENLLREHFDYAKETKHVHWSYEKEWRRYVKLDATEIAKKQKNPTEIFFRDFGENFALREVIIGAKSETTGEEIRNLLKDGQCVDIITARAAFRSFNIVRQKLKKLQK